MVVQGVWTGLDVDQEDALATESLGGFKKKISDAFVEREDLNLRKEAREKEGLEVYGMLIEPIGFKGYLHGPMDEGTVQVQDW